MAATPGWSVVTDVETTDLTPGGTPAKGRRITFQTTNGATGSVFVTDAQYTPDVVRPLIQAKVDAITAIKGLTG